MAEPLTEREAEAYNLLRTRGPLAVKELMKLLGFNNIKRPGCSTSRLICGIRNKGYPIARFRNGDQNYYKLETEETLPEYLKDIENDDISDKTEFEIKKHDDKWTIVTTKDFKTPEEAMAYAKMDPMIWRCYKVDIINNDWDITAKFGEKGEEEFKTKTNKQTKFKFFFERKFPSCIQDGFEEFLRNRIDPPVFEKIEREPPSDPHIFVVSMPDAHFGMMAWKEECGISYDTKIASKLFVEAGKTLLNRAAGYNIEKIIFPIGNDLFHMNDITGLTPKQKNRLDVDGRVAKVFNKVIDSYVDLIAFYRQYAPVEVIWVKGNHDPETSWFASKVLEAWYLNADDVTVDTRPEPQKHIVYGNNLIAWTHGDEEPHKELVGVMLGKWPKDCGRTIFREWHLGHTHKKKEMFAIIGDEHGAGVRIRVIPSLSAKDYWHTTKGYMSIRSAEGFLYNKESGYSGHFAVNVFKNEIMDKNLENPACNR